MQFKRLSKSLLAHATKCAWYAHASHNLGHKPKASHLAQLGRDVHKPWSEYHGKAKTIEQIRAELDPEVAPLFNMAVAADTLKLFDVVCELKLECELENAKLIAILDRLGFTAVRELMIEELKTTYSVSDDPFERHFYVYMADKQFPSNTIVFTRLYARTGARTYYRYTRKMDSVFLVEDPDGSIEEIDLEQVVRDAIRTLTDMEPIPAVGDQCKNWFGEPCPFYQTLCPATTLELETVQAMIPTNSNSEAAAALTLLNSNDPLSLPAETVSAALTGINKLKEGCKTVEKIIKTWSESNGQVVTTDGIYSWESIETPEIDNYTALLHMFLHQIPLEDIAKCVNLSHTSLKKLPGKYKSIMDDIASAALNTRKTRRFQRIH